MRDGGTILRSESNAVTGRSRTTVLALLTVLSALNHLDRQLIAIVLEPIRLEFSLSDLQLGLLSGLAFAALYTTLGIPAALWAVRHSRVNLVALSALVWGTMTALGGAAQSFTHLLLTRVGVGVGEAGYLPSAHAIVSSLYRQGERATALAVMSAGVNAGVFLAFLVGGVVAQLYGWRVAFVVSGLVTLVTAILFRLVVREPARPADEAMPAGSMAALSTTTRRIVTDPVLRNITLGALLTSMVSYGALSWLPSFLIRSHDLSLTQAGIVLALILGIGGAVGTWMGGYFSDRLGRRDVRWSIWFVAAAYIVAKPLTIGFFLVDDVVFALVLLVMPGATAAIFVGPSVSVLHERVAPNLRPVASAVFLFLTSFIGIGLSPVLIGALSQYVFAAAGEESLRYAMVAMQALGVVGALNFWLAGRAMVAR